MIISDEHVPQYSLTLRGKELAFENPSGSSINLRCSSLDGSGDLPDYNLRQTISIDLSIVHGVQSGSVQWSLTDEAGNSLLRCTAFNTLVPVGTYVKTGIHRSSE